MQGQGFLQSFLQTASCAGIYAHQLPVNLRQRVCGFLVTCKIVSVGKFLIPVELCLVGEMLADIAAFMKLAALDKNLLAAVLAHRSPQGTTSVYHHDPLLLEAQ